MCSRTASKMELVLLTDWETPRFTRRREGLYSGCSVCGKVILSLKSAKEAVVV